MSSAHGVSAESVPVVVSVPHVPDVVSVEVWSVVVALPSAQGVDESVVDVVSVPQVPDVVSVEVWSVDVVSVPHVVVVEPVDV